MWRSWAFIWAVAVFTAAFLFVLALHAGLTGQFTLAVTRAVIASLILLCTGGLRLHEHLTGGPIERRRRPDAPETLLADYRATRAAGVAAPTETIEQKETQQ